MAAVALATGLVVPAAIAPPARASDTVSTVTPQSAAAFVDSVGVVTHFRYTNQTYGQSTRLLESLQRLGVHHIRDGLPPSPSDRLLGVLRQLPDYGVHLNVVLGTAGAKNRSVLPSGRSVVEGLDAAGIAASVESIESANEFDLRGGRDWRQQLGRFQHELYQAVRSDPQWDGTPVVGPSTGRRNRVTDLVGMASDMDVANLHNYAAGGPPEENLAEELAGARANAPGKPLYVTETGYHTALEQKDRQKPVTEQVKADYVTRTLLENFAAGVARTYVYQLVDGEPDPGNRDQEKHFGLLRSDFSETPAYTELRTLLTMLADPGPAYTPQPLALKVTSSDPSVQHLVLQKRDGTSFVVLWKRGALFEDGKSLAPSAADVSVSFGQQGREVVRQDSSGVHDLGRASTVSGSIGGSAVVLQVGAQTVGPAGSATITPAPTGTGSGSAGQGGGAGWLLVLLGVLVVLLVVAGLGVLVLRRRSSRVEDDPAAPSTDDARSPDHPQVPRR